MTRDDIIRMAREAGAGEPESLYGRTDYFAMTEYELERFAALVAAAERDFRWTQGHWTEYELSIVAAEREACAKLCEEERERLFSGHNVQAISADKLAEAIRARGEK